MTPSLSGKIWHVHPDNPKISAGLASALDIPLAIARILAHRGVGTEQEGRRFLSSSLEHLRFEEKLMDIDRGIAVMMEAIDRKLPVTVYGDYDVDGITGTALLSLFLREAGLSVSHYIPDRLSEGYGVSQRGVDHIYTQHMEERGEPGVLITADCGISDFDVVSDAKRKKLRVIITDHHQPPHRLPEADAVINPHRNDCPFPDKNLCGAGVAFYFLIGLRSHLDQAGHWKPEKMPNLKKLLPLVALATIADQVPLLGVNRTMVRAGLEAMNEMLATGSLQPGLAALIRSASSDNGAKITSEDVAFRLGPRINAAGRVGRPERALQLLLTDDSALAGELAAILEQENLARRAIESDIFEQAVAGSQAVVGEKSLVVWGEGWHPGVIGIVASRLVEKFWKPTVVFSVTGETAKGSGRSLPGLDLHKMLTLCDGSILEKFGGHAGAAGISIRSNNLESFRENFEKVIRERCDTSLFTPVLAVEEELSVKEMFADTFLSNYIRLFPFGKNNPEPLFVLRGCTLGSVRTIGVDGSHLRFTLMDSGRSIDGVGFNWGKHAPVCAGEKMDIVCRLQLNDFKGRRRWELVLVDGAVSTGPVPGRD